MGEGWTCDDCKVCLVCGESQTNEDLIICEYCDQGVHYTCLDPPPEKRPKVWDCDDCLMERGKPPNNNVRKRNGLEPGRNLPRISSASHLMGMSVHLDPDLRQTHLMSQMKRVREGRNLGKEIN